jgi:IclR family pca regulon transcriptional regulator
MPHNGAKNARLEQACANFAANTGNMPSQENGRQYIARQRDNRTLTTPIWHENDKDMSNTEIKKQDFAQTLARGLSCLEVLADAPGPASVSELAKGMAVHRASARRILLTLESLGYVREDRGLFSPSPKVLSLGRGMLSRTSVWTAVSSEVVAVANQLNEPCSISVLEGLEILFVSRDATRRIYTSRLGVGDRLPAHCSASGKMLLAMLPQEELDHRLDGVKLARHGPASITKPALLKRALAQARVEDFATAVDEMEDGTLSIAVPLRERSRRVVAAMSVASHRSRSSAEDLQKRTLPVLRQAAERVEAIFRDFQDRNLVIF